MEVGSDGGQGHNGVKHWSSSGCANDSSNTTIKTKPSGARNGHGLNGMPNGTILVGRTTSGGHGDDGFNASKQRPKEAAKHNSN